MNFKPVLNREKLEVEGSQTDGEIIAEWLIGASTKKPDMMQSRLAHKTLNSILEKLRAENPKELTREEFFLVRLIFDGFTFPFAANELACQLFELFEL